MSTAPSRKQCYWLLTKAEEQLLSSKDQQTIKCDERTDQQCVLHCNYFTLATEHFQRCTLPDQIAIFRYIDRYVSPNHMFYLILKELLMTRAKVRAINRQTGKQGYLLKRNLVIVCDGIEIHDDNTVRQLQAYAENSRHENIYRRTVVQSTRNYNDVMANLLPGMQDPNGGVSGSPGFPPSVRVRDPIEASVTKRKRTRLGRQDKACSNSEIERNQRRHVSNGKTDDTGNKRLKADDDNNDYNDNDDDDDNNDDDDDDDAIPTELTSNRLERPTLDSDDEQTLAAKRKRKSLHNKDKRAHVPRSQIVRDEHDDDGIAHRNVYTLFSKSAKSIRYYYDDTVELLRKFHDSCVSGWRYDKTHELLNVRHNGYRLKSNNIAATDARHSAPRNKIMPTSDETYFLSTLTTIDQIPEHELTSATCAWTLDEKTTLETVRKEEDDLFVDTNALLQRLEQVRRNVDALIESMESPTVGQWTTQRKSGRTERTTDDHRPIGIDDNGGNNLTIDDDRRMFHLMRISGNTGGNASTTTSGGEFRIEHDREYSLLSLRTMIEHCVHMAHSNLLHLYDFIFFSEFDTWHTFNAVLDYGIRAYYENNAFPAKHGLWDIALVERKRHRFEKTVDTISILNYDMVWLHSPMLVIGNLTLFVQSFRHFIRLCVRTCACYFLNKKVLNTRKCAPKHDCIMPKATQGAYYAMFLRMNIGHELLCLDAINNELDAINWLHRYSSLNQHLWRKKRVAQSRMLVTLLNELRDRGNSNHGAPNVVTTEDTGPDGSTVSASNSTRATVTTDARDNLPDTTCIEDDNESTLLDYDFASDTDCEPQIRIKL